MKCPACQTENPASQRFCGQCGVRLAAMCAACGAANDSGQKFCGQCGAPLPAVTATPYREMDMRFYLEQAKAEMSALT